MTNNNISENNKREIIVKVEDLTVAYGENPVLWDIELEIKKGVLMAIVGPNGAGKCNAEFNKTCHRRSIFLWSEV